MKVGCESLLRLVSCPRSQGERIRLKNGTVELLGLNLEGGGEVQFGGEPRRGSALFRKRRQAWQDAPPTAQIYRLDSMGCIRHTDPTILMPTGSASIDLLLYTSRLLGIALTQC